MVFVYLLIGALCLYQIKFFRCKADGVDSSLIYDDYMSVASTTSVKGIFIIMIVFSHIYLSMSLDNSIIFNSLYKAITYNIIDQSVVVMFFFYSGYALMYQRNKRGLDYVKSMPSKRILKTFLHFDMFVLLFLIVQLLLGHRYSASQIVLSFIGWDSFGNQNWYIFIILILYLFTYLAFMISRKNDKPAIAMVAVLTAAMVLILMQSQRRYWWDTAMCYPLGMVYYLIREKAEAFMNKKKINYYISLFVSVVCTVVFLGLYYFAGRNPFAMILKNMVFAVFILLVTMKVKISNPILNFCGKNLFLIYIIHMLPIIVLNHFSIAQKPILFIVLTWVCIIVLTVLSAKLLKIIDNAVFKNKKSLIK